MPTALRGHGRTMPLPEQPHLLGCHAHRFPRRGHVGPTPLPDTSPISSGAMLHGFQGTCSWKCDSGLGEARGRPGAAFGHGHPWRPGYSPTFDCLLLFASFGLSRLAFRQLVAEVLGSARASFRLLNCRSWCCCSYSWSPLGHVGLAVLQPAAYTNRASLCACGRHRLGPPRRAAIRRKNEPRALLLSTATCSPPAVTPVRRPVGTRPHLGRQHLARRLPDLGAQTQLHEQNCLLLGHLLMSVPISPSSTNAVVSSIPSIAVRSTPSPGRPPPAAYLSSKRGPSWPCVSAKAYSNAGGSPAFGSSCSVWRCVWICFLVADADLSVVELPTLDRLPQLGRGVPPSRRPLQSPSCAICSASCWQRRSPGTCASALVGSRSPARMAWIMLRPVLPVHVGDGLGQFDVDLLQGLLHVLDGPATLGDQPKRKVGRR